MRKAYTSTKEIKVRLGEIIVQHRRAGVLVLPGNRDLASILDASRGTITKVLDEFKSEGVVYCSKQSTFIAPPKKQKKHYGFLYTGHWENGSFWLASYEQVWNHLKQLSDLENIKIEPILYDPEGGSERAEQTRAKIAKQDVLFVSMVIPNEFLNQIRPSLKTYFILNEENYNPETDKFLLTLDEKCTGEIAAEEILRGGYRKTLFLMFMLHCNQKKVPFQKRIMGAKTKLEKAGVEVEVFEYPREPGRILLEEILIVKQHLCDAVSRGFDSAFFISDEMINLIANPVFHNSLVPEKFGIVTVDGANIAIHHNPPITAVSHATLEMAQEILYFIKEIESDKELKPGKYLVKPKVLTGRTIRSNVLSEVKDA